MRPFMTTRLHSRPLSTRFAVLALGAALALPLAGAVAEETAVSATEAAAADTATTNDTAAEALVPAPTVAPADLTDAPADLTAAPAPAPIAPAPVEQPQAPAAQPATRSLGSGVASYYGAKFHGRRTASGQAFNMHAMTAAHKTLPFGTRVLVTNPRTGKSVTVTINDRGPYAHGRTIDLSKAAATEIGLVQRGHGTVELAIIS